MKLFYNARIYTLDPAKPLASTLLIDRGEVLATGDEELVADYAGSGSQDLGGRVVLPGLTDAHLHLHHYALGLHKVDCETATLQECLNRVEARARSSRAGEWVLGHGWNQNVWDAWPTAADIDRVVPDRPVYLTAKSLHTAWANSAALKLAGITAATPDPRDGVIQRDERGQPTGILLEKAAALVEGIVPQPDISALADAIEKAQPVLWKMGLTGVHDFDRRESFMALQKLHSEGRLRLRVTKSIPLDLLDHAIELGLRTGFGDDWLRIGHVKVFMDGALGPHTAAMFEPYEGEPENRGILNMDGEQLFEHGRRAADVGLGLTVHAIGDRANHEVLAAYEHLRAYEAEKGLPHLRHRVEHVQVLHPDDVPRLARLNVIASMQPIHATSDMLMADKYWGRRAPYAYAARSQLDAGARVAFGSDAPVESPNPFWGIHAAVTRRRGDGSPGPEGWHPEQRLSMQQAVEGFTVGPAYAAYAENRRGRLAPGYLADLIVLDKDPFECEPTEVKDLQSSATMVGGEWVFEV
jgi:predicted amidohydrolase YtcJ